MRGVSLSPHPSAIRPGQKWLALNTVTSGLTYALVECERPKAPNRKNTPMKTSQLTRTSNRNNLGPVERAVFELVTRGIISEVQVPLYRRQIATLAKAGMIEKHEGAYRPKSTPPPAPSKAERLTMPTLVARVPQEVIAKLDALGAESRSEAARLVLLQALRPEVMDLLDLH